jgi:hypothetical protein
LLKQPLTLEQPLTLTLKQPMKLMMMMLEDS